MNGLDLPQPKLGEITAITITTPDLANSLAYWQKLGFSEVLQADFPFPWIQISDGALLIMLRKNDIPYQALTYYVTDIDKVVAELETAGIEFIEKPKADDFVKKYLMQSPDGMNISLVSVVEGFKQPPGPTMLTMPQQEWMNPEKYVNKICGLLGEFAEPVADLEASILFWEKLGFKALSKYASPAPWAILSDGLAVVGLHQTKDFSQPIITFFAKDMKEKIERLKENGLENFNEHGAGNIVLNTPEQQKINLFSF